MMGWIREKSKTCRHAPHAGTALVLGLLLWARLMVATDTPKIAIAEPVDAVRVVPASR